MNEGVIRRFVWMAGVALILAAVGAFVLGDYMTTAPGDYYVRKGDQRLSEGLSAEAMKNFNLALEEAPNHRGALMGRALVYIQREQYGKAEEELTGLIRYLENTLPEDDPTGWGTLAAAYANRGIIKDRQGRHKAALDDYIEALRVDEDAVDGPYLFDEILYGYNASTVRKRAEYLAKELQKPEDERLLRLPEKDARQRMYKP